MATLEYLNMTVSSFVKPAAAAGMLLLSGVALAWALLLCAAWAKRRIKAAAGHTQVKA